MQEKNYLCTEPMLCRSNVLMFQEGQVRLVGEGMYKGSSVLRADLLRSCRETQLLKYVLVPSHLLFILAFHVYSIVVAFQCREYLVDRRSKETLAVACVEAPRNPGL